LTVPREPFLSLTPGYLFVPDAGRFESGVGLDDARPAAQATSLG
jgi:hypothetical protein